MTTARILPCLFAFLFLLAVAAPASAVTIEKDFPFELDTWYEIGHENGPIQIHRVRVKHVAGNLKSRVFRGNDTEFVETVQIQVEYTNRSDDDVEADLDIVWVDSQGREIDGYREEEDMDEDEHDEMTAALSTSKYGLEVAKTLKVRITYY